MMRFKRGGVAVLLLVALLSIAVYLNIAYQKEGGDYPVTQEVGNPEKILGEAQAVGGPGLSGSAAGKDNSGEGKAEGAEKEGDASAESAYFNEARLSREKSRDEAVSLLEGVANNPAASEETRQEALKSITVIAGNISDEARAESLIIAKGFKDCVVYIHEEKASVVVATESLDQLKATKIKEIMLSETKILAENIKILAAK